MVQGHNDNLKCFIVHDISVARQYSTKLLVGLPSNVHILVFSIEVIQTFLQSFENLQQDVIIRLQLGMSLNNGNVLKLLNLK